MVHQYYQVDLLFFDELFQRRVVEAWVYHRHAAEEGRKVVRQRTLVRVLKNKHISLLRGIGVLSPQIQLVLGAEAGVIKGFRVYETK